MDETTPTESATQPDTERTEADTAVEPSPMPDAARVLDLESQLAVLHREMEGERAVRTRLDRDLQDAVASFKRAVLAASPDLPADMVTGSTVHEVEESVQRARTLVERVRATVEAQLQSSRVPAGAPARAGIDVSGLSAREKITRGLQNRR